MVQVGTTEPALVIAQQVEPAGAASGEDGTRGAGPVAPMPSLGWQVEARNLMQIACGAADRNSTAVRFEAEEIGDGRQESGRGAHDDRHGTTVDPTGGDCQPDAHTPVDGDESTIRRGCGQPNRTDAGGVRSGLCR